MNFLNKILGKNRNVTEGLSLQEVEKIVQEYGRTIVDDAPAPMCVADVKRLPYPKDKIKKALIVAIKCTNDLQMKGHMKTAYIQLADWQENVGTDTGINLLNMDMSQETQNLAQLIVEQGLAYSKWEPIVNAERNSLLKDVENI